MNKYVTDPDMFAAAAGAIEALQDKEPQMSPFGMIAFLTLVSRPQWVPQHELEMDLGMNNSVFSKIIHRLIDRDLVMIRKDGRDRRKVRCSLTARGVEVANEVKRKMKESI